MIQLELPLIDAVGKVKSEKCDVALLNFLPSLGEPGKLKTNRVIPGLDACLCRCPECSERSGGVWWYSQVMRDTLLNKRRKGADHGEALRDSE